VQLAETRYTREQSRKYREIYEASEKETRMQMSGRCKIGHNCQMWIQFVVISWISGRFLSKKMHRYHSMDTQQPNIYITNDITLYMQPTAKFDD
jgi:hypothetical protein